MMSLTTVTAVLSIGVLVLLLIAWDIHREGDNREIGIRGTQLCMAGCRLVATVCAASLFALLSKVIFVTGYDGIVLNGWVVLLFVLAAGTFLYAMVCEDICKRSVDRQIKAAGEFADAAAGRPPR